MRRFFVSLGDLRGPEVVLDGPLAHRIRHVLRLAPGDRILLLRNDGWETEVELTQIQRGRVHGRCLERRRAEAEPACRVVLYQALLKGDHFELVLQKATELGVVAVVPVLTERVVVRRVEPGRAERWGRVLREAAEQSGRGCLPELRSALALPEAVAAAASAGTALLAWERERAAGIRAVLPGEWAGPTSGAELGLLVGPEGGFADHEVRDARGAGVQVVGLGARILRAETAAIALLAAVFHELGELAPAELSLAVAGTGADD